MCLPVVFAAATIASGVMQAAGQIQQGQSQAAMYKFQANAAQMQKQLITQTTQANQTYTQDAAARQSSLLSKQQLEVQGTQKAQAGFQGLGSSVTAADIAKDTVTKQQMDQQTIAYNANVKTWELQTDMNNKLWQQDVNINQFNAARKNALRASYIGAGTTLLSTAASTALGLSKFGSTTPPPYDSFGQSASN